MPDYINNDERLGIGTGGAGVGVFKVLEFISSSFEFPFH